MLAPPGFIFVEKQMFVENKTFCKFLIEKGMEYYSCKHKGFEK
jgi:hypothetical protein